ncbi:MAG: pyridoxal phosphate-dependent aminotransferase, partial [Cypionkella sp.]|nr:pyridoxal phosphate-dependent aminotransferase [Cypionkella sp.]
MPHVYQMAALATLDCVEGKQANRAARAEQRRLMLEGLPLAGHDKIAPLNRMPYIYADVSDFTDDTLGFARDVLHMAGVA